jgi:predicted permease
MPAGELGVFVQCAFRSNLALIGIALAIAAYGQRGLVLAALPVALMTVMYNVIAVILLNATLGGSRSPLAALQGVLGNPLIIGIALGVGWSLLGFDLAPLQPLSDFASTLFVPLALVAVGASMDLGALRGARPVTWEATLWRLCLAPALGLLVALGMGVRGDELGVLFLLLASPVAAASYVMVVAARGDGILAANLVVVTTLLSAVTIPLGFFALQLWQTNA